MATTQQLLYRHNFTINTWQTFLDVRQALAAPYIVWARATVADQPLRVTNVRLTADDTLQVSTLQGWHRPYEVFYWQTVAVEQWA